MGLLDGVMNVFKLKDDDDYDDEYDYDEYDDEYNDDEDKASARMKLFSGTKKASSEEDDDEGDASFMLILDEIERFKNLIINKYKNYIEEKEYETLLKKLEILKAEIERRRNYILEKELNYEVSKK